MILQSYGLTLKSKPDRTLPSAAAPATPARNPIPTGASPRRLTIDKMLPGCAKSHANPDFFPAPRHAERQHSVSSQSRQQQSGAGEHAQQRHLESPSMERSSLDLLHGFDVDDGKL
jgi:hypothetical protein